MITGKELKEWAASLKDDAVVGVEEHLLIARDPESKGWEDEFHVGVLEPVDEDEDEDEVEEEDGYSADDYVKYLNGLNSDPDSDDWIIGGRNCYYDYDGKYGNAIRAMDPIAFNVGYQERRRELEK